VLCLCVCCVSGVCLLCVCLGISSTHTHPKHAAANKTQVELIRRDYVANGGWETFLSYEDPVQVSSSSYDMHISSSSYGWETFLFTMILCRTF